MTPNKITIIDMNPICGECFICNVYHRLEQGLPTYEGEILPDDYQGEWFGRSCCRICFDAYYAGRFATTMGGRKLAKSEERYYPEEIHA